jgi:hypothetical protein
MPAKAGIHAEVEACFGWRVSMGPSLRWGEDVAILDFAPRLAYRARETG